MIPIQFLHKAPTSYKTKAVLENSKEKISPNLTEALKRSFSDLIETYCDGQRLIVMRSKNNPRSWEEMGAELSQKMLGSKDDQLILELPSQESLGILTGFLLASWRFNKYRTSLKPDEQNHLKEIIVVGPKSLKKAFKRLLAILEGVFFARSLTSEPPNILFPKAYGERLKELEKIGVAVELLNEKALKQIGMSAILAVGQGSDKECCVAIMHWKGPKSAVQPIVLAGKGVCFDSGGVSLKPALQQLDMKWDKAGAGVVAGVIKSLALQNAPVHVIGIVGLVENMPDGKAAKSGDVITTMSRQTVEIVDTDSEGRLVLADCLWYAKERFKPKMMIDLGTLTLDTIACLGNSYGGLYSNTPALVQQLKQAGEKTGELLWELPMGSAFAKQIESSIADVKNAGNLLGGDNAAAAEFLKRFVQDIPWAHLDIAGVSWSREDLPLSHRGVTGFGVRLLEELLHQK